MISRINRLASTFSTLVNFSALMPPKKRKANVESQVEETSARASFDYFNVDTVTLARNLLGQLLVSHLSPTKTAGVIVETEAYPGGADEASHSFQGKRTQRNEALFNPPGTFYVYYCYGRLSLCNISSNEIGAGVLIRALEPKEGLSQMQENRGLEVKSTNVVTSKKVIANEVTGESDTDKKWVRNLCNGPAKLSQALGITRENANMEDLVKSDKVYLELVAAGNDAKQPALDIHETTRIGIDYAGEEWRNKPWRFYVKGSKFISKK